jgi:acyl-CoA thioesterase
VDHVNEQELAQRCAEAMWSRDRASQALGIEISDVAPGQAVATMTIRDDQVNGHGIAHGGYVFTLADTAFAFACNTHGNVTVAAGADIVFVAPARVGERLIASAVERSRSGRNGICDVTVRREDGELVAEFRGRSRETADSILEG